MSLTSRTILAGRNVLEGRSRGLKAALPFAGPALIASIAYIDPGNFATNIQAGARYNYNLLWVVVLANVVAMLFQALSAKLGIVTGRNLAEHCRERFPRVAVWAMWIVSEIAAMATDLAEFLGGAIGLSLLFRMPLLGGMLVTAIVTYGLLTLQRLGFRPLEYIIGGLVGVIGLSYLIELIIAPPNWGLVALHSVLPHLDDPNAVTLAVGIVGATVMPHAIYLHSGLTQTRLVPESDDERRQILKFSTREVVIALGVAGLINMAMVAMAASVFYHGHRDVADIGTAYQTLVPVLGAGAAAVFLVSLIASGISSSAVGTMAGQVIMQGFLDFQIPIWARRLITMVPAFIVVAYGVNSTEALVISQVVLSIVLPVPMIALIALTARRDVMGSFANGPLLSAAGVAASILVLGLNSILLLQIVGVKIPGLQ